MKDERIDVLLAYYERIYRKVYDNFLFSYRIYSYSRVMLLRLCISSLEELDRIRKKALKLDQISTYYLMLYYKRMIEREKEKLERMR